MINLLTAFIITNAELIKIMDKVETGFGTHDFCELILEGQDIENKDGLTDCLIEDGGMRE